MSKQINKKVKVGDKVIVTHNDYYDYEKFDVGQILTVAGVTEKGADLYPEGHNPNVPHNGKKGCLHFYNQEFEVVEQEQAVQNEIKQIKKELLKLVNRLSKLEE